MIKKKFESLWIEILCIKTVDILTASTDAFDGVWVPIGRSKNNPNSTEKNFLLD